MTSRVGIVTDSSSQITDVIVAEFDVEVVPLTVTIDGVDHLEGVELDADGFYRHFGTGRSPEISTSQPSPGRFVSAYETLASRGVDEIVSLHIGEAMSGTVDAARLAAGEVGVPVRVIDTGSASFGVSICVWAAGVAIRRGATLDDVERRVAGLTPRIATAFMVGVPHLTERGGRAANVDLADDDGIAVLAMAGGALDVLDRVSTVEDTIDVMSTYATSHGSGVTVAIGTSDEPSRSLADRLEASLDGLDGVDRIVHYRIGPSVGAHTGPGTFGLFVFPTIR